MNSEQNNLVVVQGYNEWRNAIEKRIETAKVNAAIGVNAQLLALYHSIGKDILQKQEQFGWGTQVVQQLSKDLTRKFPDDRGYSERNLREMKRFAETYPEFPIWQVPLAELNKNEFWQVRLAKLSQDDEFVQVPLAQITWYHHISLISKVKNPAERAFYIIETARNGWNRDTMMLNIGADYIHSIGTAVNNFEQTLPDYQSELAQATFKDPYNFSFIGTEPLKNELEAEHRLTNKISDLLLEMGKGFAFVGRQYHLEVDGDDYYIDLLMYHLHLHCYVVVELKVVDFKPEFVSKLNFYISAVDEYVKTDKDAPTIGLLLCREKSDTKARLSLRGFTQPIGIAKYETQQLIDAVQSSLPTIEEIENELNK